MNRTLIAIWAVIVGSILAIVALAWLWNHQRETDAQLNFSALLEQQLTPYNREISEVFRDYDRQIQRALEGFDPRSRSSLMELQRHPLASLVIVASDDGAQAKLLYPAASGIELADRSLVADAVAWIRDSNFTQRSRISNTQNQSVQQQESQQQPSQQQLQQESQEPSQLQQAQQQQAQPQAQPQAQEPSQEPAQQSSDSRAPSAGARTTSKINLLPFSRRATSDSEPVQLSNANSAASASQSHWTTWYHGRGLVLGYWTGSLHNTVTMILVPRGRWLADVVAALPDNHDAREDALVQLVDVEGTVITQWGNVSLVGDSVHCPIKDAE
ncbi:MAG: hypothetical protein IT423_14295, partial [Pirellulaceae bacterium]|nr:hypothetical protein [Pirellulaceae bacterium]